MAILYKNKFRNIYNNNNQNNIIKVNELIKIEEIKLGKNNNVSLSGNSISLQYSVYPSDANEELEFFTSDNNIASIDNTGKIKTKQVDKPSDVIIGVRNKDNTINASYTLKVKPFSCLNMARIDLYDLDSSTDVAELVRKDNFEQKWYDGYEALGKFKFTDADGDVLIDNIYFTGAWQGSSTINFTKHNYKIKLFSKKDKSKKYKYKFFSDIDSSNNLRLKSNQNDSTYAKNIVNARYMKDVYSGLPGNPRGMIDGFPILLYANGTKLGIWCLICKMDEKLYNLDEANANNIMYQALGSSGACTFGSLSVDNSEVKDAGDWEDKFPATNSEENRAKLNRLIQWIIDCGTWSNGTFDYISFRKDLHKYMNLDYLIKSFAFMYVTAAYDNTCKNQTLITYDGNYWYYILYDLDLTLGVNHWLGDYPITSPTANTITNCTADKNNKLLSLFRDVFNLEIEEEVRKFDYDKYKSMLKEFMDLIPQEEIDYDRSKWDIKNKEHDYNSICTWLDARKDYLENTFFGGINPLPEIVKEGYERISLNASNELISGIGIDTTGIENDYITVTMGFYSQNCGNKYQILNNNGLDCYVNDYKIVSNCSMMQYYRPCICSNSYGLSLRVKSSIVGSTKEEVIEYFERNPLIIDLKLMTE